MNALPSFRFLAVLCAGILTITFWMLHVWYSSGSYPTPTQLDTPIYYQYAQAISEGHPYRFTESQPLSTGSTSHLYPFVLAGMQIIGFAGERITIASFGFGVICLGVSLFLVDKLERRLFPDSKGLGVFLTAINGAFFFTMLGETDIVLFTPLVLGVFLCALSERTHLLAALLVAAAWTRPEGMLLAGCVWVLAIGLTIATHRAVWTKGYLVAGSIGFVAALLVLVLNFLLTGSPVFSSVSQKGFFGDGLFLPTLMFWGAETVEIIRDYLMGLNNGSRGYTLFPVVGMMLFVGGLASRPWKLNRESLAEGAFWITVVGSMLLAASSSYSGLMYDRYFGWFLPVILLYASGALMECWKRARLKPAVVIVSVLLVLFQGMSLFYLIGNFAEQNRFVAGKIDACRDMDQILPKNSSILHNGALGFQYYLPDHTMINFSGISNTDFEAPRLYTQNFDLLKHQPEYQAGYWLLDEPESTQFWLQPLQARRVYEEAGLQQAENGLVLFQVNWDILKIPHAPQYPEVLEQLEGLELVDSLDVGYVRDEADHDREILSSQKGVTILPGVMLGLIEDQLIMDVGDVILGREAFTIATQPRKELLIVMRTTRFAENATSFLDGTLEKKSYKIANPLQLRIFANDQHVTDVSMRLKNRREKFSEVVMRIPAEFITDDETRIMLSGDHISTAFWFYQ